MFQQEPLLRGVLRRDRKIARENLHRGGVMVPLFTGSSDALADRCADIVVANISPAWVSDLADDWARILKPGGRAILSGFEATDLSSVTQALREAGFLAIEEFGENEWRMLEAKSKTPAA